jgi:hypothetical protein
VRDAHSVGARDAWARRQGYEAELNSGDVRLGAWRERWVMGEIYRRFFGPNAELKALRDTWLRRMVAP